MNKIIIQCALLLLLLTNTYAKSMDKKNNFSKDELKAITKAEKIKEETIAKAEAIKVEIIAKAIKDRAIAEIEAIKVKNISEIEAKAISEMKVIETKVGVAKSKAMAEAEAAKIKAELLYEKTIKETKTNSGSEIEVEKKSTKQIENNESTQNNVSEAKNAVENTGVEGNISTLLKKRHIGFQRNKGTLTKQGMKTVFQLAKILQQYPNVKIEIAGYTDSDGSKKLNLKLSQARVDTVKKVLVSKGIDENRLVAKGYGEASPLVPNTSRKNKQKNRRVEIHITNSI